MKLYTVAEARELLPEVVVVVEALRDAWMELRSLQAAVSAQARGASGDGHLLADAFIDEPGENKVDQLNAHIQRAAQRLDRWGIELKDPEKGLIDFFHEREGRTVYLCYLLGEESIGYWHELNGGFAGRQAL